MVFFFFSPRAHFAGKMSVVYVWMFFGNKTFRSNRGCFLCISSDGWSFSLVLFLLLPLLNYFHSFMPPLPAEVEKKSVLECVNLGIHRKIVTISRFIHRHKNTQSYYIMCKYKAITHGFTLNLFVFRLLTARSRYNFPPSLRLIAFTNRRFPSIFLVADAVFGLFWF